MRSILVPGCLDTPTAFLEAVPNAWTVTRGCLQLGVYTCWGASIRLRRFSSQCQMHGRSLVGAYNSGSIQVLGFFKTPTAFLEAVPNAWTVTRGCLQLGVYTDAGVPRNAYGVSRGSAKCMDGSSGVLTTRGLYRCWGALKRLRRFLRQCQMHGR